MSRKDYEEMVANGVTRSTVQASGDAEARSPSAGSRPPTIAGAAGGPGSAMGEDMDGEVNVAEPSPSKEFHTPGAGMRVVRGADLGAELLPHAPTMPRPVQPVPPPSFRRAQMKRDALGYALSTRERVATGTGSRFPGCAAQPPLGATMGHGLAAGLQRPDEFYFPGAGPSLGLAEDSFREDDDLAPGRGSGLGGATGSPRQHQGQIVSKHPTLAKQLFPAR